MPLVLRDIPGWAAYFGTNEFLKDKMGINEAEKSGEEWSRLNLAKRMWCGGVAGQASWLISYPMDIVKTEIQCTTDRKLTIREAFIKGYQREGARYFFKGLAPSLYRTFIVNLITLPAFDYMTQFYMPKKD